MAVIDNLMDLAGKAERELDANVAEVDRILHICNACRYCESFCAVFSAMTRRLDFNVADAHYMANLCHNCSACLYACQYAPPHEFGVNLPKTLSRVRRDTYMEYAFPKAFGELYRQNGLAVAMAVSLGVALFLIATILSQGSLFIDGLEADFYAIFPHNVLAVTFGAAFGWSVIALAVGISRFWRQVSEPGSSVLVPEAIGEAAKSALTLKYLGAATVTGATTRTTHSRCGAAVSITLRSTGSCSASRLRRWRRSITICGAWKLRIRSSACRSCSAPPAAWVSSSARRVSSG